MDSIYIQHLILTTKTLEKNCSQNDASNTLPGLKINEIKVIRKKPGIHENASVRAAADVLAKAVMLLAVVLLILHGNHNKNFSAFDVGRDLVDESRTVMICNMGNRGQNEGWQGKNILGT
ncbi:hypothetical protein V6N13_051003 [Hibiscus sabdariffa]